MEYRKCGDTYIVRLDRGDEVIDCLEQICCHERVALAEISGLGAAQTVELGVYSVTEQKFYGSTLTGALEISNLTGSATTMDGEAYLHLHITVGDEKGMAYAGHLKKAVISATGEFFIRSLPGNLERRFDPEIGLNVFDFIEK